MTTLTRRALIVATLFAVSGCAGTAMHNTPYIGGSSSSAVNRLLVPAGMVYPVPHYAAPRRSIHTSYSTKKSLLYESDFSRDIVNIFETSQLSSNPTPIAMIGLPTGGCPYDMALDKKGNLWISDQCLNQIEEYGKGSTVLKTTITSGSAYPGGIAIDKSGTMYVSEIQVGEIEEYAPGSTTPSKTITGMSEPFGISLDKSGNLFIPDYGCGCVWELPAGGSSVTNLNLTGLTEPVQSAVDKKTGYLWVTDGRGNQIQVYDLPSTTPVQTIPGQGFPYAISIENKGKPKSEMVYGDQGTDDMYVFKPGSYSPSATIAGYGIPSGVLIAKP